MAGLSSWTQYLYLSGFKILLFLTPGIVIVMIITIVAVSEYAEQNELIVGPAV